MALVTEQGEKLTHGECDQCGWMGLLSDTIDIDLGFGYAASAVCPSCRLVEVQWQTEAEHDKALAEYED